MVMKNLFTQSLVVAIASLLLAGIGACGDGEVAGGESDADMRVCSIITGSIIFDGCHPDKHRKIRAAGFLDFPDALGRESYSFFKPFAETGRAGISDRRYERSYETLSCSHYFNSVSACLFGSHRGVNKIMNLFFQLFRSHTYLVP